MTAEASAEGAIAGQVKEPLGVVVLGGGGHVGLPLSLAFARSGLRVGIVDIAAATLVRLYLRCRRAWRIMGCRTLYVGRRP